jgi:hypothetical protein
MRLAGFTLWFVLCACERPPAPNTPQGSYLSFAEALRRGDSKGAWGLLSKPTQAAMEARARRISEASRLPGADGGVLIKNEPALMLFQSGNRPGPIGEVALQSSDAGAAVLTVGADHQAISMVREGERWVVDLSATLQDTPP